MVDDLVSRRDWYNITSDKRGETSKPPLANQEIHRVAVSWQIKEYMTVQFQALFFTQLEDAIAGRRHILRTT